MKTSVVCVCLCLFVASNAFVLNDGFMDGFMTLNMMQGRSPFDMSMFGGNQQQSQQPASTGSGKTPGASGTGASQPSSNTGAAGATGNNRGSSLFSNPLWFGIFGDGLL